MEVSAIPVVMMHDTFTHEVSDDPMPRRRVRISGPVYDDSSVPLLRIEFEGGDAELMPPSDLRLYLPLDHQMPRPFSVRRDPHRRHSGRR
jgi:hypothetical protein